MSELSENLKRWADELDSGKWTQHRGALAPSFGKRCVLGVGMESIGVPLPGFWGDVDSALAPLGVRYSWDRSSIDLAVDQELRRITGREAPCRSVYGVLPDWNDYTDTDFPTFARAIRTVALQLEEQESGEPIPAAEVETRELAIV